MTVAKTMCTISANWVERIKTFLLDFFFLNLIASNFKQAISIWNESCENCKRISDNDDVLIEQRRLNKKTVTNYYVCSYTWTWAIRREMMCTVLSGLLEIFGVSLKPPLAIRSLTPLAFAYRFENTSMMTVEGERERERERKREK